MGETDCLDEELHTRKGTQHANFDQHANCGVGCAGNPWDSSGAFAPTKWLALHEAGHNLQTGLISGFYVTAENRNDWAKYQNRGQENSNNIFAYVGVWNDWYIEEKNTTQFQGTGHQTHEHLFYSFMSDKLGKDKVYADSNCLVLSGEDRFSLHGMMQPTQRQIVRDSPLIYKWHF